MINSGYVKSEIIKGKAVVEFFHPKSNSLPSVLLRKLTDEFVGLSENKSVKVIVLKSSGDKAFCAGASFDELLTIDNFESGKEFFMGFARLIIAMKNAPQFILGRIHGKAVGGGVGLASAVDYAFATKNASVRLSELALGIGPFVISPAVERKIGKSAFAAMSIDSEWRSAEWAKNKGLYEHVYESVEDMDVALAQLADKHSKGSFQAISQLKKTAWEGTENWDVMLKERAEISGRLVLSDFTKNFISSFKDEKK